MSTPTNNWVFVSFEPGLFTVGFYGPDKWHPESDHTSRDEAAARVHYLNGGISACTALLAIAQRCEDYINSSINGVPMQVTENLMHPDFLQDDLLKQLRAAISKATGGQG